MKHLKPFNESKKSSYWEIGHNEYHIIYDAWDSIQNHMLDEFSDTEVVEISNLISNNEKASRVVEFEEQEWENGCVSLNQSIFSEKLKMEVNMVSITIYKLKDEWFNVSLEDYRQLHFRKGGRYLNPGEVKTCWYYKCDQFDGLMDLLSDEIKRFY